MRTSVLLPAAFLLAFHWYGLSQSVQAPERRSPQPLYQVTIVSRTTKALNYGYLSAPTRIGFQGTPIAAESTGEATVEPKRGATLLNIRVNRLPAPGRYGAQYLTYVVWAISPEGRAQNVGELILDGSDRGKLSTSTPMQTFALIVTAEPYYSVSQPSDVVVLENVLTRDTIGQVQEVNATYELLPRKPYTYNANNTTSQPAGQAVSAEQYESITALYQALNAIQIAQAEGADRYAPKQMARARQLYNKARTFPVHLSKEIVSMAREATQIADDGRTIAARRAQADKAATAAAPEAETEQRGSAEQPQVLTQPAPPLPPGANHVPPPDSARARTDAAPPATTSPQPPVTVDHGQFLRDDPNAAANRRSLLAALPRTFEVVDTSRGITITIPGAASSAVPQSWFDAIAAAIRPYRDLHIRVEAHSEKAGSLSETRQDAERVKRGLSQAGVAPETIVAGGLADTRPRAPKGRVENRRIEITIAGDAIGTLAVGTARIRCNRPACAANSVAARKSAFDVGQVVNRLLTCGGLVTRQCRPHRRRRI